MGSDRLQIVGIYPIIYTKMINAIHILGQILFGGFFVWQGLSHFIHYKHMKVYTDMHHVPAPGLAVLGSGLLILLGGLGVLFNVRLKLALIFIIIFLIPVTFTMHAFWTKDDPEDRARQQINFLKNIALLGATFLLMY